MSEPIKAGDLVIVVLPRPECGCHDRVGRIFRVTVIRPLRTYGAICGTCGHSGPTPYRTIAEGDADTIGVHRLKRIPPLGELDDVKQDEEITA